MKELSPSEARQLAEERAARRSVIREAYQRIYNNPFRQTSISDPAVFRYEAARAYAKDFYKFTPKSIAAPIAIVVGIVVFQLKLNKDKEESEAEIRSGQKTYYERAKWSSRFLS